MRYLLDTHILLWTLMDKPELSPAARDIIINPANQIFYSTVSVWEVAIKHLLHPQQIPCTSEEVIFWCGESDIYNLPLQNNHVAALKNLHRAANSPTHKDPFDRILIAQANAENMILLTHDKTLQYYINSPIRIV